MNARKIARLVEIDECIVEFDDGPDEASVGVKWSSPGTMNPATARRFAIEVLRCAEKAEKRRAQLARQGLVIADAEEWG